MVIITIRPKIKSQQYSTVSLDEKLESLINENKESNNSMIKKIITKEFNIEESEIEKYWIVKKIKHG